MFVSQLIVPLKLHLIETVYIEGFLTIISCIFISCISLTIRTKIVGHNALIILFADAILRLIWLLG